MSDVFSSPSDGCVLLVDVPMEPLMVHKSVGENSGSLIGPRRVMDLRLLKVTGRYPNLRDTTIKQKDIKTEQ